MSKTNSEQSKDSGIALTFLFLIFGLITKDLVFVKFAVGLLLATGFYPDAFYILSIIWFGIARVLSFFATRVLLSVVFFTIVTPIAVIRRVFFPKSLRISNQNQPKESMFKELDVIYTSDNLIKPF